MPTDGAAVTLRPITPEDMDFLLAVYASTRAEEMDQVPWSDEQKADFLRFQFEAQHRYYQEHFPAAAFDLIVVGDEPVGRLYVDRLDIALLPERRGSGLGSQLLDQLLNEAREASKLVRIHVEHNNPAMRLYLRLGFEKIEEQGVYHLMEWRPSGESGG